MTEHKSLGTDFTEGAVMPMLLRFFVPFLLANLLNSIYNMVDTIIIGQFVGSTGIVAVTMGGKMLNIFTNIGLGFAGGGQILISQLAGAHRRDEYNATIGTLLTEMAALSVVCAAGTLLFARDILTLLNTPADAFGGALGYLRITSVGLPLIFGYNAVSSVLRGMGDSKRPLIFIAVAAGFNLVGDLLFVVVFEMGAAGTAVATVLGQGLSLAFSVAFLYRRRERFGFDFRLRSFAVDWKKLWLMVRLGLPVAVRSIFITGTQLVMMGYVNLFGLNESAAYSISDKFYHLANIFSSSVMQSGSTLVAQNIGAERRDRVKTILRCTAVLTIAFSLLLSAASLSFPRFIFGLFTPDEAVIDFAPRFMPVICLIYLLSSLLFYDAVVTGTGFTLLSMIGGILDGLILRVGFSFFFAYACDLGVLGFLLGDALARLGPISIDMIYYYSGAWKKRKRLVEQAE